QGSTAARLPTASGLEREGNPRPAAWDAELRREKISESMKLLQDLIPGCSKHVDAGAVARS
ncbi:unnamed protein product, partial [Urochloa humidicola]